jgi:thioredoxin reductase (NADPH)
VENHPGFPHGIEGPELAGVMAEHLEASGAELVREEVTSVETMGDSLAVRSESREVAARSVIVASGTRSRDVDELAIPSDLAEKVHYESRELWGERGASIAIIGGGDAALDYAFGLAEENDVTVLVRGGSPRALPILVSRLERRERARVETGTRVAAVRLSLNGRIGLEFDTGSGERTSAEFDHLLVAVGRDPEDSFLSEGVQEAGAALAMADRLLFAGDVRSGIFRQSSIAAGLGTLAAMRVAMGLAQEQRTEHS